MKQSWQPYRSAEPWSSAAPPTTSHSTSANQHHRPAARGASSRRALGWLVRACIGALALKGLVTPLSEEAEVAPIRNSKRYKQTLPQRRSAALAPRKDADHLVVVAGHAVTMAESLDGVDALDSSWYLLDYQRRADVPSALVKHIEEGVRITARDPKSVLVFSGGQTRRDAGPRSEGQSYWHVAEHFDWWGTGAGARATTEEYARDSLENVLFAACRFKEVVGRYPKRVTVVSYDFKRRRFVELLGPALHLPLEFVGVAPGGRFDAQSAAGGEATAAGARRTGPLRLRGRARLEADGAEPLPAPGGLRRELPGPAAAPRRVRQGDGPGRGGGVRVAVARVVT